MSTKERAIICDIDGTIAIKGGRDIYDYESVHRDTVREAVLSMLQRYRYLTIAAPKEWATEIILLTGRMNDCRSHTERWLFDNAVPYDTLHMRPAHDYRPDTVVKREIYDRDIAPHYEVEVVIDDRDSVVRMFRDELRLPVFQVDWGNF